MSLFAIGAVGLKENLDLRRESNSDSDSVSGFDGNGADEADGSRPAELLELTPQSSRLLSSYLPPLLLFLFIRIPPHTSSYTFFHSLMIPMYYLRAIFANGILHGFSWDGAPSLAPALAMTSWRAGDYRPPSLPSHSSSYSYPPPYHPLSPSIVLSWWCAIYQRYRFCFRMEWAPWQP